jgi:hypothetical protein
MIIMDDYRTIVNILKSNPNIIDDIAKINNSNMNVLMMENYEIENYLKKQELNRNSFDMVEAVQEIQLFKWIYEQGNKKGKSIKFEKFLKELLNDDTTLDSDFRNDIMDVYSNALAFCRDIEEDDKIIKKICNSDIQEVFDYINKRNDE